MLVRVKKSDLVSESSNFNPNSCCDKFNLKIKIYMLFILVLLLVLDFISQTILLPYINSFR